MRASFLSPTDNVYEVFFIKQLFIIPLRSFYFVPVWRLLVHIHFHLDCGLNKISRAISWKQSEQIGSMKLVSLSKY